MYLDIYRIGYFGVGEKLGPGKVFCLTYFNRIISNHISDKNSSRFLNGYIRRMKTKPHSASLINSFSLRNEEISVEGVRRIRECVFSFFFSSFLQLSLAQEWDFTITDKCTYCKNHQNMCKLTIYRYLLILQ